MSPDDPRHGTYAGWQKHRKDHETACEPCRRAEAIYHKRMMYQLQTIGPVRGELGEPAWRVIDSMGRRELSRLTGLRDSFLSRLHKSGPTTKVYRRTREALLAARPPATPLGVQRRLRALFAIGYPATVLARELGMSKCALRRTLNSPTPRAYHHQGTTDAVVELYDRLELAPMPTGAAATAARNRAAQEGWAPPFAWDDIDDPDAVPDLGAPDVRLKGGVRSTAVVLEDAEFLADDDLNLTNVLERLGIQRDTFHAACRRGGRMDLYWRLANREPNGDNLRAARDGLARAKREVA